MTEKKSPETKGMGLVDVGMVTTALVPLLYLTGWSFAYHYFDRFHLGLIGLDIPKEYLFLYSFWVIKDQFLLFVMALLSVIGVYTIAKFSFQRIRTGPSVRKAKNGGGCIDLWQAFGLTLLSVMVLTVFCFFYFMGSRAAGSLYDKQVVADFPSYPRVKVWLADDARKDVGAIADIWGKGCFRLLLQNKDNLYIFESAGVEDKVPTEIIPMRLVRSVRVLPQYHRCVQ